VTGRGGIGSAHDGPPPTARVTVLAICGVTPPLSVLCQGGSGGDELLTKSALARAGQGFRDGAFQGPGAI
jgi:hypothetical protein